ncbi:hypothetical protein SNE40_010900 [Patella caerulea]|uniref:Uncharacterized protein n=1 Tax=Patella caerulea TaxID=87958 RepID=A0AAN8JV50_PATCE
MEPVFLDERNHTVSAFDNNTQRHRFLQNIKLSFPIDIYRYAPGGSHTTVVCIVHVDDNRNEVDKLTQIGRVTARIKPLLPVYHTREMKKSFKSKLNNISNVAPSVLDFIYKELAIGAAVTSHPHTQQRLRMIFLGETGLLADLRKLNPGRPTGTYDTFFEKLGEVVESVTAADERRHGIAHLSEWLSLKIDDKVW